MKQYEIRWALLPEPVGRRPVVLLSRTPAFTYLSRAVVAEVSTTIRSIPQEVRLGRPEGLDRTCVVNLDNIQAIHIDRIGDRIGSLGPRRHVEVKRALGFALDLPELKAL